ncbi:MAG: hypothetical protein ACKPKO_02625, partial [Candidatus Fonsibacter sp.]
MTGDWSGMPQLRTLWSVWISSSREAAHYSGELFTQHGFTLLSTGQLHVLEKDTYRVLPRSRDPAVQQCVLRLSRWAGMAKAVVWAELPDFLVVIAFSVFVVEYELKAMAEMAVNQTHCQRLAKLFLVDAQALASHTARHRPTTQAIKKHNTCNDQEAWQQTVQNDQAST